SPAVCSSDPVGRGRLGRGPQVGLLDIVGAAVGRRRVRKVHVPLGAMRPLARLLHRLPGFPVTPDQLRMLEEDNTGDAKPFLSTFGFKPTAPLAAGIARILA